MDIKSADEFTQIREMVEGMFSRINTCLPGIILSFDSNTQRASVQPAIKTKVTIDGESSFQDLPKIINVPLVFPFAVTKGFALTIPVSVNDPCLLFFAQRATDNWIDHGEVQPPEEAEGGRHHSLTDAFALLTPVPMPNVLGSWENEGIELRNTAKDSRVTVKNDSIQVVHKTAVITVQDDKINAVCKNSSFTMDASGIDQDGGTGSTKGVVQGDCICAYTGGPHPMISQNVKASL